MSTKPSISSDRVRLAILVAPRPSLSLDECRSYWPSTHSKGFFSIGIVKRDLLKYEQVRMPLPSMPFTPLGPGYLYAPYRFIVIQSSPST